MGSALGGLAGFVGGCVGILTSAVVGPAALGGLAVGFVGGVGPAAAALRGWVGLAGFVGGLLYESASAAAASAALGGLV